MKIIAFVAAVSAFATASYAGETLDGGGEWTGTSTPVVHMLGEGHMLMNVSSKYENYQSTIENNPMVGMQGDCFGALEFKGPAANGSGLCAFANASGDTIAVRWTAKEVNADGALIGMWEYIGATGALAGITGSGEFASTTDQATGIFKNVLTGSTTLP